MKTYYRYFKHTINNFEYYNIQLFKNVLLYIHWSFADVKKLLEITNTSRTC